MLKYGAMLEREEPRKQTPPPEKLSDLAAFHGRDPRREKLLKIPANFLESLAFRNGQTRLEGQENLEIVRKLKTEGGKLILASNHLAYPDPFFVWISLKHFDFPDISENLVFIVMESLYKSRFIRAVFPVGDQIGVYPLGQMKEMRTSARNADEEKRLAVKKELERVKEFNGQASTAADMALERGNILFFFPEGQRSFTQSLSLIDSTVTYLVKKADFVVPVGIWGTEKIMPINLKKKIRENPCKTLRDFFSSPVTIKFGKPYPVSKETKSVKLIAQLSREIADCLPEKYRRSYGKAQLDR